MPPPSPPAADIGERTPTPAPVARWALAVFGGCSPARPTGEASPSTVGIKLGPEPGPAQTPDPALAIELAPPPSPPPVSDQLPPPPAAPPSYEKADFH